MVTLYPRLACILAGMLLVFGGLSSGALRAADPDPAASQLPEGDDVDALFAFIKRRQDAAKPTLFSRTSRSATTDPAIRAAAEKILKLENDPKSEASQKAAAILLDIRIESIATATPEEQRETLKLLEKSFQGRRLTTADLRSAKSVAMTLEDLEESGAKPGLAAEAYAAFAKIFAASREEKLRKSAVRFEGAARRLSLVGKPLELRGTMLDGKPFDWDRYRGKVVLVDFWATWCEPCRAELPNVRKNYEKYHGQGFDVVGISVDDDRDELDKFLEDEKLPWVTLTENEDHPGHLSMSDYYGIIGIPAVFLVDKAGKVVSLHARGEELDKQLALLLGPAKGEAK